MGHLNTTSCLTSVKIKELFHYDPDSGDFTYKVSRGCRKAGDMVGWLAGGYRRAKVCGKSYPLHRVAFLYMTGNLPDVSVDVDHINGNKSDNRWSNLRLVTRRINIMNKGVNSDNELGVRHVRQLKDTGKFQVRVLGKSYGCYPTHWQAEREAKRVYKTILRRELDGL